MFQSLSPEKPYQTSAINESFDSHPHQTSTRTSIYDKSSLREAFQRIKIAGDFLDMSHIEDLEDAVGPLLRAMVIREKYVNTIVVIFVSHSTNSLLCRYMIFSLQSFPLTVAKFLNKTLEQEDQSRRASSTIRANTGRDQTPTPLSSSSSSSSIISSVIPFLIVSCVA